MVKKTREYDPEEEDEDLMKKVHEFTYDKCYEVAKKGLSKSERGIAFDAVKEELLATFSEEELEEKEELVTKYFYKSEKEAIRNLTLDEGIRLEVGKLLILDQFGVRLTTYHQPMVHLYLQEVKLRLLRQLH